MITSHYCLVMATYNAWMNEKMYALCEGLSDVDRKRDLGAYFQSIHGTLNHILACDLMFLASFTNDADFVECEGDLHDHFSALRQERTQVDSALLEWSKAVSPDWLAAPSIYTHHEDGAVRTV
ncbi:MAG TPA: DinB family protein, partial [Rhizobacter sp.]|nr:DinB family protein [Rhizobacter sp.]